LPGSSRSSLTARGPHGRWRDRARPPCACASATGTRAR
jgi:hypothetical protein